MSSIEKIIKSAAAIIPETQLSKLLSSGKKLTIKLGADPTAPDLHLGHAIVLRALRRFQEAGHRVIFLIGDFTARIGDPTGRSKTRPPLSNEQIESHSQTYFSQVGKILDRSNITIEYNSKWLSQLSFSDLIKIASHLTVARLIEREDFAERLKNQIPISLHELFYPLMQGYDSVALQSDIELGGTDQTFNLLVGRSLQEKYGQAPQVVMTFPLLRGTDGIHKMSKSQGNTIGLSEHASHAFGKLMSISDTLMWHYYEIILEMDRADIALLQNKVATKQAHPMLLKKDMAFLIIKEFWSHSEAEEARLFFENTVQEKDYSHVQELSIPLHLSGASVLTIIKHIAPDRSSSEVRRLILAGAVSIDSQKIVDPTAMLHLQTGNVIKAGKHLIVKIILSP